MNRHVLQNHYTHSLYPLVGPLRLGVPDQLKCLLWNPLKKCVLWRTVRHQTGTKVRFFFSDVQDRKQLFFAEVMAFKFPYRLPYAVNGSFRKTQFLNSLISIWNLKNANSKRIVDHSVLNCPITKISKYWGNSQSGTVQCVPFTLKIPKRFRNAGKGWNSPLIRLCTRFSWDCSAFTSENISHSMRVFRLLLRSKWELRSSELLRSE